MLLDAYDEAEAEAMKDLEQQSRQLHLDDSDEETDTDSPFDGADPDPDVEKSDGSVQFGSPDGQRLLSDDVEERQSLKRSVYVGFDTRLRDYFQKHYPEEDVAEKAIKVRVSLHDRILLLHFTA
jgi:hypothetical protein